MRFAPHNGTATSRNAATSMQGQIGEQEGIVLLAIKNAGRVGVTRDEIAVTTGLGIPSVCARCNALLSRGVIKDSGITRRTSSGRQAVVLIVSNV
jgi:hypothetical protein